MIHITQVRRILIMINVLLIELIVNFDVKFLKINCLKQRRRGEQAAKLTFANKKGTKQDSPIWKEEPVTPKRARVALSQNQKLQMFEILIQ